MAFQMLMLMSKLMLGICGTPLELTLHAKAFRYKNLDAWAPCVYISVHETVYHSSDFLSQFNCRIFSDSLFLQYPNVFPGIPGSSLLKNGATAEIFCAKVILSKITNTY